MSLSLNSRLTAIKKHFWHCRCILGKGGVMEWVIWWGVCERIAWEKCLEQSCAYLLFFFFFFSVGKTKRKNKFYPKCTFFCIVLKTEISSHLAWNICFSERNKEKEGDGCYCLSSTPRLLHHLARRWEHRFSFVPLCENVCEFSRNKQVTYTPGLAVLSQSLHALSIYE